VSTAILSVDKRWLRAILLGLLTATALAVWLYKFLPEDPSSTLVGRSPLQIRSDAHREYLKFLTTLKNLAGPSAKECGAITLRDTAESGLNCGESALSEGKSFWLAVQLQGVDSEVWAGLVQDEKSNSFSVNFDSDESSGGHPTAEPSLTVAECGCPEFHPQERERRYSFGCLCPVP